MIKVTIKFENTDKDGEDTVVQSNFKEFEKIQQWLEKVKTLYDEEKIQNPIGFLQ